MNLNPIDILKLCLSHVITILVLDADTTIVIELALEVNMVGFFNPKIIASS